MVNKKTTAQRILSALLTLAVFSTTLVFMGCPPLFSDAKGKVLSVTAEHDMGLVNGEADYGFTVTLVIKNVGGTGEIRITPGLSCSEGEWDRTQTLQFRAQETKRLTYFFHEPTVNASNCHYGASVWPKVSE